MGESNAELRLWELVREQQARIDALEAKLISEPTAAPAMAEVTEPSEARVGRRAVFGLAGVGVAAAAAMVVRPDAVAAADNDPLLVGAANTSVFSTTYTKTNVEGIGFAVTNSDLTNPDPALAATGAVGLNAVGRNSYGATFTGEGVGQIRLLPSALTGGGQVGRLGSLHVDAVGDLYLCTVAGTPGTWVKLNGQTTGVVQGPTFLPVPQRGYDSRPGSAGSGTKAVFAAAETRTVNIATDSGMPLGKSAALVNVTVTSTGGSGGFVSIYSGAVTLTGEPTFSTINWFGAGQSLAASTTTAVSPTGTIKIFASAPTNVLIDVLGHYA